jgi:CRP/FNR family transcriptional regulator
MTAAALLATPNTVADRPRRPLAAPMQTDAGIDIEQLRAHIPLVRRRLQAGQSLYHAGQKFDALYLVHAGFFRVSQISEDGREQVIGFRMRGELLGAESIGLGAHVCDAVALDTAEVWELPFPPVLKVCSEVPELQARLSAAMADEMRRDRQWMLAIGTLTAEQRVATFLLDLAARHAALGFSAKRYLLRMSRMDIASYLALKHETVSRILGHLSDIGCIAIQRRDVTIIDDVRMRAIACVRAV